MHNFAYGDCRAEKFAYGDPITLNEIVRIWGLTYIYDTDIFLKNLLDDKCSACSYL